MTQSRAQLCMRTTLIAVGCAFSSACFAAAERLVFLPGRSAFRVGTFSSFLDFDVGALRNRTARSS